MAALFCVENLNLSVELILYNIYYTVKNWFALHLFLKMYNMKWFFVALLTLSFAGCKKIDKLTQFHYQLDETTEIPALLSLNLPFDIYTPNISTNITKELEINNTKKKHVESIVLEVLELTIQSPGNGSFDFLKSIEISLISDGLPEVVIATKANITDQVGNKLLLDVNSIELREYILKDTAKIKIKIMVDQIVTKDYTVFIHTDFKIDAKVFGI